MAGVAAMKITDVRSLRWLWALSAALILLSIVLRLYGLATENRNFWLSESLSGLIIFQVSAVVFTAVGILITSRYPLHPIGLLCLAFGILMPIEDVLWQFSRLASQSSWVAWLVLAQQIVSGFAITLPITFITLLFPSGRLPSPGWRWVALVAIGAAMVEAFTVILQPFLYITDDKLLNPLYVLDVWSWASSEQLSETLSSISTLAALLILVLVAVSLGARWHKSEALEKQQMKWLFFAVSMGLVIFFTGLVIQVWYLAAFGIAFVLLGMPVAIAIALLRYRLYDIDLIINRALLYGALTVFVVGGYVLIVGTIGALLGTQGNLLLSLIATGLVAVAFHPVRERLQRGVNRLVYGQRREPYAVVSQLGRQLESSLPQDDILRAIAQTVGQTLKLSAVDISVVNGGVTRWESDAASVNTMPQSFALAYRGELLGEMRIILRPGEQLQDADRALLNDLARQAAIAVHSAQITTDLQRSRERIVTAREEERRRLRRDLHDGLGPTLASLYQRMETVLPMLTTNPAEVAPLLTDARAQIKDAIASIRQIVYALRPPVLDELGLAAAVREESYRLFRGGNAPHVEVIDPENLPQLSAAVAAAAYRIIMEALVNVLRHSGATHCQVIIQWQAGDRALTLEISDDGSGLPEQYRSGVGMQSMRERAEELGGRVSIEPRQPIGTLVRAVLPVSTEAA